MPFPFLSTTHSILYFTVRDLYTTVWDMYFTLWFLYFTLWYTENSYSQILIYLYESYNYFPHSPLQTYTRLKNECYLLIHVIKHVFHLQVSLKYLPLQRVFHSIRFKVNKGWSSAELLFLCPYPAPTSEQA